MRVDVRDVEKAVEENAGTLTIVDACAASRHAGEGETIDRAGGHIPGALNRPYLLSDEGTFKSGEELRSEFEQLLAGAPAATVVSQCGSGVTACHICSRWRLPVCEERACIRARGANGSPTPRGP